MSHSPDSKNHRALLERALHAVEGMQSRLDAQEYEKREPIAIIGMGCRFPGNADSLESFWSLLCDGVDAIREVPPDRWNINDYYDPNPDAPGKMCTRLGGFLEEVDKFDPSFFGISPRETLKTDPQQRLLLEVSWEALENAALAPQRLMGSRTGVFIGITNNDYARLVERAGLRFIDAYHLTGSCLNFAAGRIAYVLGLQGPTMAVDTACSSSGVTIHLACQSLRNRECHIALAGGVNLILSPEISITSTKAKTLSPDGYCKTFDASANGYVRGEGCGIVILKRLSDARADGDHIHAVIRGSAVLQDGASSGLTVPNKLAQEAVIREALLKAGVRPNQVDYVEAHGTGTPLGDPIEIRALGSVYRHGRLPTQPLAIGAVKTNVGHLESAAGVAGLIKVALSLQHGLIPPHLHFKNLNPAIVLEDIPAFIPTKPVPWVRQDRPRLAGLSFFGGSGTIAHMIVEEPPPSRRPPSVTPDPRNYFVFRQKIRWP